MVARVCLVSSGSGGHLWPAVVLGRALSERGHDTWLLTEGRAVERDFLDRIGLPADTVDTHRAGPLRLLQRTAEARSRLRARGASAVVCTGGRTSLVVGLAARSLGLPVCLLEQNVVTGRANRVLARFARRVYLGLPNPAAGRRALLTGTPLRPEIGGLDRAVARRDLGVPEDACVVLVTGGSQGAGVLNERVPAALCRLGQPLHVLHLSGDGDAEREVRSRYHAGIDQGVVATVRPRALDMHRLYAAADLVVARGGGCTVAELCAAGRAALIVPYPHHRDRQQYHNARVLAAANAARIVEQRDLDVERLTGELRSLLRDRGELARMGVRAKSLRPGDPCGAILADLDRSVFAALARREASRTGELAGGGLR